MGAGLRHPWGHLAPRAGVLWLSTAPPQALPVGNKQQGSWLQGSRGLRWEFRGAA